MKVLVTGATGFIGKALAGRLLEEGHEVVCLVRKTSQTDFLEKGGAQLLYCDIKDSGEVEEAFRKVLPEYVFHCAARVKDTEENLYRANVLGTRNICKAALRSGTEKVVYLSSVAVVSGNKETPLTENLPYKTTNAYGRSKTEAERIVMDFRRKGLPVAIIRPCMVYGEGEPHALPKILEKVQKRHIPTLAIAGLKEKLHLVSVENVVQALELALEKEEALRGTFFIADSEIITLRRFLEIMYDELGVGPPPVIPEWLVRAAMVIPSVRRKFYRIFKDRVYDISRARDILGYTPRGSTEEGLRRAVKHWKEKHV